MKKTSNEIIQQFNTAIFNGDVQEVLRLIELALAMNISPKEIMKWAFVPACKRIAEQYRGADFNIPDVIFALHPIMTGLKVLRDNLPKTMLRKERIVIGTVAGDIHDIGKNIVIIFLQMAGFDVTDLGVDVTADQFLDALKEYKPKVLALSAQLTTTMGEMANVIEALNKHHLRRMIKVVVGGGPMTEEFAKFIRADGFAFTAPEAVDVVLGLLKQ